MSDQIPTRSQPPARSPEGLAAARETDTLASAADPSEADGISAPSAARSQRLPASKGRFWTALRRLLGAAPPTVDATDSTAPLPDVQASSVPPAEPPATDVAWISMPRAEIDPATIRATPLPPGVAAHVLLAEADPTTARVLQHRLERDGLAVTLTDDADATLDALASKDLDLLLLDADLPGGAFQVLRRLRRGHGDAALPVILLTWPGNDLVAVRAFGLGSNDVVTRPLSLAEVAARVRYQIQRSADDRLADRLADRVEDRLLERLVDRLEARLANRIAGPVAARVADRLGDREVGQ